MSWQNNAGDIIIDVVLTDVGRARMAEGNFNIAKFALGDSEIDYGLYNKNHGSGSSYYDLDLLQLPIFEAFTNNTSVMRSKLLTINKNNLLYLPVVKLSENVDGNKTTKHTNGYYVCLVDETSEDTDLAVGLYDSSTNGLIKGREGREGSYIRVDQGLDTTAISYQTPLDADLIETQYIVERGS